MWINILSLGRLVGGGGHLRLGILHWLGFQEVSIYVYVYVCLYVCVCVCIFRVSQEECARLRESVPYVKVYRYNSKHLYPKLNGYGDNGQRSLKL